MTEARIILDILASVTDRLADYEHNRTHALNDRLHYVKRAREAGATRYEIAEAANLSPQRVSQILKKGANNNG